MMKASILILFILGFLAGCENTKGQNRHDPNHHEKTLQKQRE
ncbi:MAG: hypothetical protein ACR65R_05010 [Methylomicrobium sp.]